MVLPMVFAGAARGADPRAGLRGSPAPARMPGSGELPEGAGDTVEHRARRRLAPPPAVELWHSDNFRLQLMLGAEGPIRGWGGWLSNSLDEPETLS